MKLRISAALVMAALACISCRPLVVEVDPPNVNFGDEIQTPVTGDPMVEIGMYHEQLYSPLLDNDPLPIVNGAQGGTWAMPALRTRGLAASATVHCLVVTDEGEVLGESETREEFALSDDNFMEVQTFPVPVLHAPPRESEPIDDLFGKLATLTCTVTDDSTRTARRAVHVELVGG
ncbi:MAG: hypothetical protein AB2A00_01330 [Myxococcota bacterium]